MREPPAPQERSQAGLPVLADLLGGQPMPVRPVRLFLDIGCRP